eukprot:gene7739-9519_t
MNFEFVEDKGEIEVPYKAISRIKESIKSSPPKFLISHAKYSGIAEPHHVSINVEYFIRVYQQQHQQQQQQQSGQRSSSSVINDKNSLRGSGSSLFQQLSTTSSSYHNHHGRSGRNGTLIQLFSKSALIKQCKVRYSKSNKQSDLVDFDIKRSGGIIIEDQYYHLLANQSGLYVANFELHVPYLSDKHNGFNLTIPNSSNNSISFKVMEVDTNIKIFNSFPDIVETERWIKKTEKETNNYTIVFAKLPIGTELKAQWTVMERIEDVKTQTNKPVVKTNIVANSNTLCSIGEGLLTIRTDLQYKIVSGVLSNIKIALEKDTNIINVTGGDIKKWDIVEQEHSDLGSKYSRQLQIQLNYAVEKEYSFSIFSEFNMRDTSGELHIPSFVCRGEEISRQRGFLGVEARTNVEISEVSNEGLQVVDSQEIPQDLSKMASHPILLSYKFLDPRTSLNLQVKRNEDCPVLVSICEEAHFVSTVSYSGQVIHQLILRIKNTQKQFLRIDIPFQYDQIWSSILDGTPIRPSLDNTTLLVPLLKPGITTSEQAVKIEIILLQSVPFVLGSYGKLKFEFPKIDLSIRTAFSTIYLPESMKAYNFNCTSFKHVNCFSSTPPSPNKPVEQYAPRHQENYYRGEADSLNSSLSSVSFKSLGGAYRSKKSGQAGVIPVYVEMPTTNVNVKFEQIFIQGDKDLKIEFEYKQTELYVKRRN